MRDDRRLRGLGALAASAVAGTALLVVRDPHEGGSFATCPSLLLLGVQCPGCGSLRGVHDLATGQVAEAVGHNLLLVPALAVLVWWWAAQVAAASGRPGWARRVPAVPTWRRTTIAVLAVLAVFTVLRNLPGSPLAA